MNFGAKHGDYKDAKPSIAAIQTLKTYVPPGKNVRILDAGSGVGRNYVELAASPYDVYAIDSGYATETEKKRNYSTKQSEE